MRNATRCGSSRKPSQPSTNRQTSQSPQARQSSEPQADERSARRARLIWQGLRQSPWRRSLLSVPNCGCGRQVRAWYWSSPLHLSASFCIHHLFSLVHSTVHAMCRQNAAGSSGAASMHRMGRMGRCGVVRCCHCSAPVALCSTDYCGYCLVW
ncbi:hypothetical protein F4808DRAFT_188456 [Astrocystis sublimbata]|nr:hypothetical protein F4808DRAFT_188456 [Astrocystis sublimbata]